MQVVVEGTGDSKVRSRAKGQKENGRVNYQTAIVFQSLFFELWEAACLVPDDFFSNALARHPTSRMYLCNRSAYNEYGKCRSRSWVRGSAPYADSS